MKASKVAAIGTAAVVTGGLGWYGLTAVASDPSPRTEAPQAPQPKPALAPATANAARAPDQRARTPRFRKIASREVREQLLHAIRTAHQRKRAAPASALAPRTTEPGPGDGDGELDPDIVLGDVMELQPLIHECFVAAREVDPTLSGQLLVSLTIEGEPGIGALVTESTISEHSQLQDPGLRECVQETMYALELTPPFPAGTTSRMISFHYAQKK